MSNKCSITEALKGISKLNDSIDNVITKYDKKISSETGNLEENQRVLSSLLNMSLAVGSKWDSLYNYADLYKEAKNISDKVETLSKNSPILEAVKTRYGDNFVSLSNSEGVSLSSVVQIAEPTVLNSTDINGGITGDTGRLLTETENAIQAALRTSGAANNSPLFTEAARTYNPALNFFSKALNEGEASNSANIVAAVRTSVDNYLVRNFSDLASPKTTADLADMFNLDVNNLSKSDFSLIGRFRNGGSLASIEGHKLGQMMMDNLGLRASPDADIDSYNSLVSGFGQIGLLTMAELGYLKPYRVNAKTNESVEEGNKELEDTGKFYKEIAGGTSVVENGVFIRDDIKIEDLSSIESTVSELNDLLDIPKESSLPSFEPVKESKNRKIRRQPFGKPTKKASKALDSLEKVEHTVLEEPLDLMVKAFTGLPLEEVDANTLLSNEEFKDRAGIIDTDGLTLSKDKRESIEAQNKAIADKVRGLFMVKDEQVKNEGEGFFYKWFIARNHRLHMHNTVASPQDDKLFSRWFIQPKAVAVDVKVDDIARTLENPSEQVSMEADNFLYGLVQAFDGHDPVPNSEKVRRETTIRAAKALLTPTVSEQALVNAAKKADHLGHSFLAVDNIRKYKEAVESKSGTFNSTMVREIDGKTNGFAHKVLQFPLGNYKELLKAVGIFTEDTKNTSYTDSEGNVTTRELDSTADKVANGETPDVYQLVAFDTYNFFNSILGNRKDQVKSWLQSVVPENKQKTYIFEDEVLNSAVDIKKGLRDFTKGPTTHSMYGALAYNAGQNKTKEITADILDGFTRDLSIQKVNGLADILEDIVRSESALKDGQRISKTKQAELGNVITRLRMLREEDLKGLQNNLINDYLESSSNELLNSSVSAVVDYYYGQALENALKSQFGPHEETMQTVNAASQFIYDVFKKAYTKRKKEVITEKQEKGINSFTQSDHLSIVKELLNLVPGVKGVDSEGLNDSGIFIKPTITNRDTLDETTAYEKVKEVRTKLDPNPKTGLKTMSRGSYLVNHAISVMVDSFSDPRAGTLPLSTHMLDAANLVRAINEAASKGNTVLPLHDAVVLGTGDIDINKSLNKTFFEVNSEYSIMASLADRFSEAYKYALDNGIDVKNDKYDVISALGKQKTTAEDIKNKLLQQADDVLKERKNLFDQEMIIGQFVGNKGTLYKNAGVLTKDDSTTVLYKEGVDPFVQTDTQEKVDTSAYEEGGSPSELVESSLTDETINQRIIDQLELDLSIVAKYDCK